MFLNFLKGDNFISRIKSGLTYSVRWVFPGTHEEAKKLKKESKRTEGRLTVTVTFVRHGQSEANAGLN